MLLATSAEKQRRRMLARYKRPAAVERGLPVIEIKIKIGHTVIGYHVV